jgi:hypothetical protein
VVHQQKQQEESIFNSNNAGTQTFLYGENFTETIKTYDNIVS